MICVFIVLFFFFKQKTAYEMRISDWSSDVCFRSGLEVRATGKPISVPVGKGTLGRIMNVLGDPIDEVGPVETETKWSIHRDAPTYEDQDRKSTRLNSSH